MNILRIINTPLGTMNAIAGKNGITELSFQKPQDGISMENHHGSTQEIIQIEKHLDQLEKDLQQYFNGQLQIFSVPLEPKGTDFQKTVWKQLLQIEFGETITYQQQAHQLNNPKAIRAIASANGQNPIAIIVPCHRVIGSDGSLSGYAGGIHRKKWLLEFEKRHSGKPMQMALFKETETETKTF